MPFLARGLFQRLQHGRTHASLINGRADLAWRWYREVPKYRLWREDTPIHDLEGYRILLLPIVLENQVGIFKNFGIGKIDASRAALRRLIPAHSLVIGEI
ncbi:hypothetical protein FQZ97_916750 [compost metagenome]